MNAITFITQKDATDYQAADAGFRGYPKVSRVIGTGRATFTSAELTTAVHAAVVKHPTLPTWAYKDTSDFDSAAPKIPMPLGAAKATLDATWDDAIPVTPSVAVAP